MKTFNDLKVGDKIYRFDHDTYEITYRVITDIQNNHGYDIYFCFNGKMNLKDDDYEKYEYIRLDYREMDSEAIDSGWAIADLDEFLKNLKEDFEEIKAEHAKIQSNFKKAIIMVSDYINNENIL